MCSRKIHFFKYRLINEKSCICFKCFEKVPLNLAEYALENYRKDDFEKLFKYLERSDKELKPIFKETNSIRDVRLDINNKLIKLDSSSEVYALSDFTCATFSFIQKSKENKVDFVLNLKSDEPRIEKEYVICSDIIVEDDINEYSVGNDFSKYLPSKIQKFMDVFNSCYVDARLDILQHRFKHRMVPGDFTSDPKLKPLENELERTSKALVMSLKIFGYESLEGITQIQLTKRKESLLKAYKVITKEHANEIEDAYQLLSQLIFESEEQNEQMYKS